MIAYHQQISLKQFGPPEDVRGYVDVCHMRLFVDGAAVAPTQRVPRAKLLESTVELACGSIADYKLDVYPACLRIPYAAERHSVRECWRKLSEAYAVVLDA